MRFVSESSALGRAATFSARHTSGHAAPIPALTGLRIATEDGAVRLTGYDYEASSTVLLPVEVEEPGEVLLPGRVFAEIVHALPSGSVEVRTVDGVTEIRTSTIDFTLPTLPLQDYPELPQPPDAVGAVDAEAFTRAAVRMARIAMRDDVVPVLTGTLLELTDETVTLTSSDRYRIAIHEQPWKPTGTSAPARAVVSARMLADAAKSLGSKGTLTIGLRVGGGESLVSLGDEHQVTTMRLLDDNYPPLRSKVPTEFAGSVTVGVEDLRAALRRVCIVADRYAGVVLGIEETRLVVGATGDVDTRGSERLPARLSGAAGTVSFNAGYLLDGLEGVDTDFVVLSYNEGLRPALLRGTTALEGGEPREDSTYVAMPRRLS
ncbi:DNA polymerase III subunit beta [Tenggerimyces flavus]|uniref:DNA polymerase III subunit beta n=1 Tax=Tenggerimyces flavus TaxID=1708749 RepID=A0ABV7YJB1_9ACTN|nr:DNA polymerase III subunit beta [Tenggerimyces flavus]MBM7783949.1 DNA polymerase-3 subunit beta [Tenggerimyces flavus]